MHGIEESLKLKRTLLLSILAVVPAALMPLAAIGQVAPDRDSKPDKAEPSYKYEVFAGYGYTSLNQVNQSRSGLQGPDVIVTRNWGKYFAITADGAYYKYAYESGNPGTPSVQAVLFGPVIHTPIAGRFSGFGHVLLGGEHLAGGGGRRRTRVPTESAPCPARRRRRCFLLVFRHRKHLGSLLLAAQNLELPRRLRPRL
jgi:hypothetical protein